MAYEIAEIELRLADSDQNPHAFSPKSCVERISNLNFGFKFTIQNSFKTFLTSS